VGGRIQGYFAQVRDVPLGDFLRAVWDVTRAWALLMTVGAAAVIFLGWLVCVALRSAGVAYRCLVSSDISVPVITLVAVLYVVECAVWLLSRAGKAPQGG
jgi:hypothetical protein